MVDVDYEDVVFTDYKEYNSKLEKEKAKHKSDLRKQKNRHEAEYTNYIILDPICITFDPEEASKQNDKFMESRDYNVTIDFENCLNAASQP